MEIVTTIIHGWYIHLHGNFMYGIQLFEKILFRAIVGETTQEVTLVLLHCGQEGQEPNNLQLNPELF